MPPSYFLERLNLIEPVDTWAGFERSAEMRYFEGIDLLARGWTTGAIYLLGYVVECLLKAATFRASGIPQAQQLNKKTTIHAGSYAAVANTIIILDHDLPRLGEQLKNARINSGNPIATDIWATLHPYLEGMSKSWSETLRYRSTEATAEEAKAILRRVDWIVKNYALL